MNLVDTLNGGQVTVFAPGTTHFPTASEAIASLQTDAARLTHLLTYHVIPGGSVLDYIKNNTPFESDIPGTIVQHRVHDAQGGGGGGPATGIVASGTVLGNVISEPHWDGSGATANYVPVAWEMVVPPDQLLPTDVLQVAFPQQHWRPQNSGILIRPEVLPGLEAL